MNICVVIVTFNRKVLLQTVLDAFETLSSPPNSIVIVDNNSTDGTDKVIKTWKKTTSYKDVHCIRLPENIGGSGGFYEGIQYAMKLNPDWIWLSDDDAIPDQNAFVVIREKITSLGKDKDQYSALCCTVINQDNIDGFHRRRLVRKNGFLKEQGVDPKEYFNNKELSIDLFSFVGVVINTNKLKLVGLPEKDYFIWYDDTEYSWRLSSCGKVICLMDAKIHHDVDNITNELSWKMFYGIRNRLLMYKKHHYLTYLKYLFLMSSKVFYYYVTNRNLSRRLMMKAALSDAISSKMGIHSVYKPGWKIK